MQVIVFHSSGFMLNFADPKRIKSDWCWDCERPAQPVVHRLQL